MIKWLINGLIIAGSALMVVNISGFIWYAHFINTKTKQGKRRAILYIPIVLLCFFLLGYLAVWIFGSPDMVIAGILFGGSIFVFIMLILLSLITRSIIQGESLRAELLAAEESNRTKNAFLATISHEMRTPVNVILGLDELALKRTDLPEETRVQLLKIQRSGRHLEGLINNTLYIQNAEAGKQLIKNEAFRFREVTEQIEAMISTMCEEKGLKYQQEVDPMIPEVIKGDELLLKQALMNVLDNAVKYTAAPGNVIFSAEMIRSDNEACVIMFIVNDTGIGISREFLPKVFDIFSQEDGSFTNRYGGSGMGLAVTKQKVELMNGDITAESEQGVGSTFTIDIPFYIAEEEEAKKALNGEASGGENEAVPEISLEGCRILIVEDLDENAEIVADLLELEGAESEHAENGYIALGMFERSKPGYYDAILMDLRMPVMDGLESTRSIRSLPREDAKTIPIIALSANAFETDRQNSADAGMNAHLVKPIDSDLLYQTLRIWIAKTKIEKGAVTSD